MTTLFIDVGGVVLTNGWDRVSRRHCIDHFGLDWEEFSDRHDFVADAFETGRMTLDQYLERTVFYRDRPFARDDFVTAMCQESQPLGDGLTFVRDLAASGRFFMATLNNESRELNDYRVATFGLDGIFDAFFTSGYVGLKKPDMEIFQMALDVTQTRPEEAVFVDDRRLNLECAGRLGMRTILFENVDQLRHDVRS